MTATIVRDTELVKQALGSGQLSVLDPSTGYHRQMYADCPAGHQAAVHRIARTHSPAIDEVTMRCAQCGAEFIAPIENIYLK